MKKLTFHLIPNAHLDPVWLWDARDGLNEGIITCRTVLNLMDEFDDLTFIRGETAIYEHIERHDPPTFRRIAKYVEAGRWEPVGGTVIQPDTNLPAAETFARHFAHGQNYFISRFGKPVRVAWAADSFGHCAGLPEIMANAGITGFAFTRPFKEVLTLAKPAFWWESASGAKVLGYRPTVGWYGTNRDEIKRRLDATLEGAATLDLENVGVFYGLGNHGGGPCRQQLREIREWVAAHPEINVVHSGLHRLFDALRAEKKQLPTHRGELNFTLRGCYASVAKFKFAYRKTESVLASAERTDAVVRSALRQPVANLRAAWDTVLFNSFHDILPGSSIERAYDEQIATLGGAQAQARDTELAALNALALKVDTRVAKPVGDYPSANAILAWNPHPVPFRGHIEWESNLDYREIVQYKDRIDEVPMRVLDATGKSLPFQSVALDSTFQMPDWFWRKRVVVPVELPAFGWNVFEFGWVEGTPLPAQPTPQKPGQIENGIYRIKARKGDTGVEIFRRGKKVTKLAATVVKDASGSWGNDANEFKGLNDVLERWRVTHVETLEHGPERTALWVRFAGKKSWLGLTFHLYRDRDAVDVSARLLWDERAARLKLVMPVGAKSAEFETPAARVRRQPCGEVPGGRWVRMKTFGFASDALYCFDVSNGTFRATVARASGYSLGNRNYQRVWQPAVDSGELKFRFLINPGNAELPALAQLLEQPPVTLPVAPKAGPLPRAGSFAALSAGQLLALKRAEDGHGLILRVQETTGKARPVTLTWGGRPLKLGKLKANEMASWRLLPGGGRWAARRTSIIER